VYAHEHLTTAIARLIEAREALETGTTSTVAGRREFHKLLNEAEDEQEMARTKLASLLVYGIHNAQNVQPG
jgi:hypothetical protein